MSPDKKYSVVVVGCGKRGMHHADAFFKNPRFQLVGLCDIDQGRLEAAAKQFGNPETSLSAGQLLKKVKPDVFCFCTLPNLRLEMVRLGVEAGAKLIAFEKPTALSTNEALEIMNLVRKAGVKTTISHQHRYGEHYKKVKEIIASGAIGRVHTVYGTATGWMMHMMTHLIEYTRWFNDCAEAEWVVGQAAGKEKFKDNHPSPDYVAGVIQYANGVRGIVEAGDGAPDVPEVDYWWRKCRMGAQGTEGFAEVLTGGGWRAITRDSGGVISGTGCMDYAHDTPPYVQEIADWLDDPKKVHPCDGESAYKGFEIMMAICRSVVERGKVKLPLGPGEPELEALERSLPD
ncbi:MAG TPA: Gfo/Idh/MocA family oxidoreductase [Terriglobia bacterium]|nr:Gfo/Idh/MocA family oxidoreductase [Terriglobia bacterium]